METSLHNSSQIRLLIADDHVTFAEGLGLLLGRTNSVIETVSDGRTLVEKAIRFRPDVVVTDISVPLLNGLAADRRIRRQVPKMKFVFLTMHDDPNLTAASMVLGRVAFVLKQSGSSELLGAIEHVLSGQSYLTPRLRPIDLVEGKARMRQSSKDLTTPQDDGVQLFAEGRPLNEIASILNLTEKTIQFHQYQIMRRILIQTTNSSRGHIQVPKLRIGSTTYLESGAHIASL